MTEEKAPQFTDRPTFVERNSAVGEKLQRDFQYSNVYVVAIIVLA